MKRFLSITFILTAVATVSLGFGSVAYAQVSCSSPGADPATCIPSGTSAGGDGVVNTGAAAAASAASAGTSASSASAAKLPTSGDSSPDSGFGWVMTKIMSLFAWLVGVAAMALDYAVYYTVVTMGTYIHKITAIGVTWRILRDLGNIALIFGFIAIGITTILNVGWYGGGTKFLPKLLIAAVFLNFSLFATEAVIDVGNLFATQFFNQINGGAPVTPEFLSKLNTSNEGISNKIMAQLGLQTIYTAGRVNPDVYKSDNLWTIGFLGIILFIITAFVMFTLAFILVARFVVLVFLIITAPIGFVGLAIPRLESKAKLWWSKLFEQTITAPILLLLLYVALSIITDAQFLTGVCQSGTCSWTGFLPGTSGSAATSMQGFAGLLLSFLIAMGLLLVVVMASKSLSAAGASWASRMGGRLSFGATAWAGRAAIGTGIGRGLLGNTLIKRGAMSNNKLVRYSSRLASFTGKRLQNRTFDVRNAPGAATAFGKLGIDAGTGSQLTAKQLQEKKYGWKPTKEWFRDASKQYEKDAKELDRKNTITNAAVPTVPPNAASLAVQKELKNMSADELSELTGIRAGIAELVHNLTPEKFNELMKSDKLLAGEKAKIKATWDSQFNLGSAANTMSRFTTEEIAALGGPTLLRPDPVAGGRPVVDTLGTTELDAIRRKGNLSKQDRHDIYAHMSAAPTGSPLNVVFVSYFDPANDPGRNREKYWNV